MALAIQLPTFLLGRDGWPTSQAQSQNDSVRHIGLPSDQSAGLAEMFDALQNENPETWQETARLRPLQRRFECGLDASQWHALGAFEDGEAAALRISGFPQTTVAPSTLEEPLGDWPAPRGWPTTAARIMLSLITVDRDPLAFGSLANPQLCRHVNRWTRVPGVPTRAPVQDGWRTVGLTPSFDRTVDAPVVAPQSVGFGCVRNPRSEPLSVVLLSDILSLLDRSEIEALQQPDFRFALQGSTGNAGSSAKSPVLTSDGRKGMTIRYDQNRCSCDQRAPRPARSALDALQNALRKAPAYRTVLQDGETLLIDNHKALCRVDSGRMSRRWLIRIFGGSYA